MFARVLCPFFVMLVAFPADSALAGVPLGDEFQVNTYTTSFQLGPSVAVEADGDFVVVWDSDGSSGSDSLLFSIQGQRFDSTGAAVGTEFQVNTYTSASQRRAKVASDADGGFIVVWQSNGSSGSDSSSESIQGQRYDSMGVALGGELQVNTYTSGQQQYPAIAMDGSGDFIVVWQSSGSSGSDSSSFSIQGQRFDSAGVPIGDDFQVNTYTTDGQRYPAIAMDASGNFVVVWHSDGGLDASSYSVQGQRFDSGGAMVGSQFQVDSAEYRAYPDVAMDVLGEFIVVWHRDGSSGSDTSSYSVQGQRFDASGAAVGSQFQVNTYTTFYQGLPMVAVDALGDFVVVWNSLGSAGSDTSTYSIQGQRFDSSGVAVGDEFQINTYTTNFQLCPRVDSEANGDFIVVWASVGSSGSDASSHSIQSQRFINPKIFADGFESGDASAWN